MKDVKKRSLLLFIIGALLGIAGYYIFIKLTSNTKDSSLQYKPKIDQSISQSADIYALTKEDVVIEHVKKYHKLPEYYLTKSVARKQGWVPSQNNLCDVLPGKAIGGDRFQNREKRLPKSEQYYEADVNYHCGQRNADRIIFTKQGKVYLTRDHYKTFIEL